MRIILLAVLIFIAACGQGVDPEFYKKLKTLQQEEMVGIAGGGQEFPEFPEFPEELPTPAAPVGTQEIPPFITEEKLRAAIWWSIFTDFEIVPCTNEAVCSQRLIITKQVLIKYLKEGVGCVFDRVSYDWLVFIKITLFEPLFAVPGECGNLPSHF